MRYPASAARITAARQSTSIFLQHAERQDWEVVDRIRMQIHNAPKEYKDNPRFKAYEVELCAEVTLQDFTSQVLYKLAVEAGTGAAKYLGRKGWTYKELSVNAKWEMKTPELKQVWIACDLLGESLSLHLIPSTE